MMARRNITDRAHRKTVKRKTVKSRARNPVSHEQGQAAYGAGKATGSGWRGRFTKGAVRKEFDNWVEYRKGSMPWLSDLTSADRESLHRSFYAGAKWGFDSAPTRRNPTKIVMDSRARAMVEAKRLKAEGNSVKVIRRWGGNHEVYFVQYHPSKRNPSSSAAALYESFHGKPATEELVIEDEVHEHEHLAVLGRLVEVFIETPTGLLAHIEFDQDEDGTVPPTAVMLCSSEDGKQLYFEGGDQNIDLASLKMDGEEWVKDRMVLGTFAEPEPKAKGTNRRKHNLCYHTRKDFDKLEPIDYQHDLGEESGERPLLEFDPRNKHLYVSGGQYRIDQPLLETSPGIEN